MPENEAEVVRIEGQEIEVIQFEDQKGIIRKESLGVDITHEGDSTPNQFTGPSFRNQRERFRFDGHKMLHHLDRVQAWQRGERFAPIHIDMGLTKFCNTACIYCYAVVQNMTKGAMIQREPLLNYIEDCAG